MKVLIYILALSFFFPVLAQARVVTETVTYEHEGTTLRGYLAYDDALAGKRPGVLVVHEWWGLNDNIRQKTRAVAALGYVAFAADIYGGGKTTTRAEEAASLARRFLSDRELLRARARAALGVLEGHKLVDPARLAAIGFCFGGTTVLELARSGAPLLAAVSFHGGLSTLRPADARNIRGTVLALHGARDPFVTGDEVRGFREEMGEAGVDWYMVVYGHALHSFTNPGAGDDSIEGTAYNEKAARRAWQAMAALLQEKFGKP
jgi:dienelactone hydrolase